ncbi:MAG: GNAT family N-acetyltransferase [Zavarzinella sp.]
MLLSIEYPFQPIHPSPAGRAVCQLFGIRATTTPHRICHQYELQLQPNDLVLITGASGSGKSSILRDLSNRLGGVMLPQIPPGPQAVIDLFELPLAERFSLLASCGLAESRLLLRSAQALSEGQRYRLRLALALAASHQRPIVADEFAALLDRTTAKVLAYTLRRRWQHDPRTILLATSHDDLLPDLQPTVHIHCQENQPLQVRRLSQDLQRPISFHPELHIEDGTMLDWYPFAQWHYRSRNISFVRSVQVLKHVDKTVGVIVFAAPAASLRLRTMFFGWKHPRTSEALREMNRSLWVLSRVVMHPQYRGAGLGRWLIEEACKRCPVPWIETLAAMGEVNPVFEHAGFARIGQIEAQANTHAGDQYGRKYAPHAAGTPQYRGPVYYIRDNRKEIAHYVSEA